MHWVQVFESSHVKQLIGQGVHCPVPSIRVGVAYSIGQFCTQPTDPLL